MRSLQFFKHLITTILLLSSCLASAGLISRDYLEWGDGGITYDDVSGYEWLDLTYTRTLNFEKYQEVLARSTEGWMFADTQDVVDLFAQFTLTDEVNEDYGTATPVHIDPDSEAAYLAYYYYSPQTSAFNELVEDLTILGETLSIGTQNDDVKFYGVRGYVYTGSEAKTSQFMAYRNERVGVASLGDFRGKPIGNRYESFFTYRLAQAEKRFDELGVRTINDDFQAIPVSEPATFGMFAMMLSILVFRRYQS
jgi:hypothetical protein